LSLDLPFAATKSLTARVGPTPTFTRGSGATYIGSDGLIHGVDTSTTSNTIGTGSRTFTLAATAGQDQLWRVGDAVEASNGSNFMVGTVTSYDAATQSLVCNMTSIGGSGTFTSWRIGYRGPRFDHTSAGVCRGLLIEESRTNSITGSNAFNTWTLGNTTVASSSVVTPEGTADAWKLVEDSLLANHNATRPFTPVSGTTYTASVWLKSAENSFAFVGLTGGGFFPTFISVNLSTGAVSTATGTPVGASSVSHSNGWWRVSFSLAATASLSSNIDIRLSRDGNWANRSYLGNGVNGMYCYGGQVEAGSFATSYIPTTTSSLARSADVCSITGANFTSFYNQSEGTLLSEASIANLVGNNRGIVQIDDDLTNNFIRHVYGVADGGFRSLIRANIDTPTALSVVTGAASTIQKRVIAYAGTSFASSANGAAVETATRTMPTGLNNIKIGYLFTGLFYLSGHIASIRYYKKRLPNAKLVTLTT
jgi:hypothetical protein